MKRLALLLGATLVALNLTAVAAPSPAVQARIDAQVAVIATWAADPIVIAAVRAHNQGLTAQEDALTQEDWHSLSSLDPLIHTYTKGPLGTFLSAKQSELVGEAFVSDAAGYKVGFINKPTRWCHAGQPKHDTPMAGKTWQGRIERDESTGLRLIQISVPVLEDGKPIGSLVVGLSSAILSD